VNIEEVALETLERLCRQPSISTENLALPETANLVQELFEEHGFETRQLQTDGAPPAVWGERSGRSPYTLLLYNHYDVQPVDPLELWDSPPFEPTVRDGNLYARGAADNKGQLATRLTAIRELLDEGGELPIGIRWIVEGEEEIGSPHFEDLARTYASLLQADACLWEGSMGRSDGRPGIGLGVKGVLFVRLDVRLLQTDAHSSLAAIAPSAAWRMVEALAAIRDPDGRVLIPGFYDAVREPTPVELELLADHGDTVEDELRDALGIDRFLDGLTGEPLLERLGFAPTCNVAGIQTGYAGDGLKTVLPAAARACMDFRLVPDQRPDLLATALRSHLDAEGFEDVELTVLGSAEPVKTRLDHPFVRRVTEVAEQFAGRRPAVTPLVAATLPLLSSLERHVGVAGLAAPDNPVYSGCRAHAPNEHVRLADLAPTVEFTRTLLTALGEAA
jgi:acetylornithine deacetylase/succinyl-diaminopimelate desuccinylase-like protein